MINTIRCCISCILPCGAFDVIRIVHTNGYVEELSGTVFADEIMKLHPKHVLKKPSSSSPYDGGSNIYPQVVIIPPEAQLQRGKIYFLMPVASTSSVKNNRRKSSTKKTKKEAEKVDMNDQYLAEILSEKVMSTQSTDRRRGRAGVWRPHLESISEAPILYDS
ncbi:putative phosphatidylinositol 4-phosphate 5-kinase MSS4 [Heracleum sosnowskyi]|uniref:Phosphatidylinositol 4-phosphate 5-kinase MSS4 n=1 Tax=Heracleum sosnowskyi TaxID=360622 RepID=A0AAD8HK51_9APIA|nr:putative phosphatidylinositol 4-phosphate 5-kinase MSS4 [Heracleum sosnowskyi]